VPATINQLNISPGGVPKLPVLEAEVGELGLVGDGHRFPEFHGGPNRAVCLFSLERIHELQAEGHPIFPGSVGENVTVTGLDWEALVPGVQLELGNDVRLEITNYTVPCKTIAESFLDRNFPRISQKVHPGYSRVYARVLRGGKLMVGDNVRVLNNGSHRKELSAEDGE
jgi:MOSC domain-containing protein YiiM